MALSIESLRRFDAFSKPLKDFRIKTLSGALVSIISNVVILVLFLSELAVFMTPQPKQEIIVDVNRDEKMSIALDITMNYIPCGLLKLDTIDMIGEEQIDVEHELYKTSVTVDGTPISESVRHAINDVTGSSVSEVTKDPNYCGSCYGADSPHRRCCNTCEEVQIAYAEMHWVYSNLSAFVQCRNNMPDLINTVGREGCRIHGLLTVNKVAGSFHIAPGFSYSENHVHIHDIRSLTSTKFNLSHSIKLLSFGATYPGQINPLDNVNRVIEKESQMVTYYLKLVPTMYTFISETRKTILTNQYSATWHMKNTVLSGNSQGLPGLFFNYEIAPILVKISEVKQSFLHFLTSTCAIVGGVFTVASLLDSFIYHSSCVLRKRYETISR